MQNSINWMVFVPNVLCIISCSLSLAYGDFPQTVTFSRGERTFQLLMAIVLVFMSAKLLFGI